MGARTAAVAAAGFALVAACDLGTTAEVHGGASRAVEVVDLTGDGAPEVVASGSFGEVVLVNDGSGALSGVPVSTPRDVRDLAVGDVNADGAVDRVELEPSVVGDPGFRLALGDGNGGFGVSAPLVLPGVADHAVANDVELADMDADGDDDLLWAGLNGGRVHLSDRTGAFPVSWAFGVPCITTPTGPYSETTGLDVFAVDFEGDGDLDVLWNGECDNPVGEGFWSPYGIAWNNEGTFTYQEMTFPEGRLIGVAVADVTGDGVVDRVLADKDAPAIRVDIGLDPDVRPTPPSTVVTVPTAGPVVAADAADIDGDGHVDLVVATAGSGVVGVLYGDGTGAFPEHHPLATGRTTVETVTVADLDADGRFDVVAGTDNGAGTAPAVVVFGNTRDGRQH